MGPRLREGSGTRGRCPAAGQMLSPGGRRDEPQPPSECEEGGAGRDGGKSGGRSGWAPSTSTPRPGLVPPILLTAPGEGRAGGPRGARGSPARGRPAPSSSDLRSQRSPKVISTRALPHSGSSPPRTPEAKDSDRGGGLAKPEAPRRPPFQPAGCIFARSTRRAPAPAAPVCRPHAPEAN